MSYNPFSYPKLRSRCKRSIHWTLFKEFVGLGIEGVDRLPVLIHETFHRPLLNLIESIISIS